MKNKLGLMFSIVAEAFEDREDKGGRPYFEHCLYVMQHTDGDDCVKIAALAHDLIEDTDWTIEALRDLGYSEKTLTILDKVTHKSHNTYAEYIEIISKCPDCINLKQADLTHNSSLTRLKGLTEKDFERSKKYQKSYMRLEQAKLELQHENCN